MWRLVHSATNENLTGRNVYISEHALYASIGVGVFAGLKKIRVRDKDIVKRLRPAG